MPDCFEDDTMDEESQWCEGCQEKKCSAYRRPDAGGRTLCNDCHLKALARLRASKYVAVPSYLRAR